MSDVRLRGVSAGYSGKTVVSGVSVDVPGGGWLVIVGPNGAGKSTLLKAIAGLVVSDGEIVLAGQPSHALSRRQSARIIGYAPQNPILPDGLTVTDYVLLGRTPHLGPLARESAADLDVVHEAIGRLDLTELAGRTLRTLSGGERQRAVLARVLAQQPTILLLDEPTTGLDIGHAQAMLELIDRLRREDDVTVVATLHDLTFAAQYADQLMLLDGGEAVAAGTPARVLTADRIAKHYDAAVHVLTADDDLIIAPARP